MVDFLAVAVAPRKVKTQKYGELDVTGISVVGLASLIKSHPELIELFKKGAQEGRESMMVDMNAIIDLGADFSASFLAAGLGHPGNEDAIQRCKGMNPVDLWALGEAIIEETFPGGAKNFFTKVGEAAQKANIVQVAKVPKAS